MKFKNVILLLHVAVLGLLLLASCGSKDASKEETTEPAAPVEEAADSEMAETEEETPEAEEEPVNSEQENEETTGAVMPKSASETISFNQVTWFGGAPKRELNGGVWYYTASDHPEKYDDTFEWEDEDVLLWQISDEEYRGYNSNTEQLKVMDNDVVKIIVKLDEGSSDNMPRNFLTVGKGSLEGKGFIIETVDGERLSLE